MKREENIYNVPNFFTASRFLITFVIIYMVFADYDLWTIALLFFAGMITDAIDGNIARIFHMKTEFGRKFDMAADRFLFAGTILAILIHSLYTGTIGNNELIKIGIIMLREIVGIPAIIWAYFCGDITPKVRIIGKATTVLQAIAFPSILIGLSMAWPLTIITGIVGLISGIMYNFDVRKKVEKKKR
jgi:cardiolipin synthase (CMP-forming)